jgi:TPR repeat protein
MLPTEPVKAEDGHTYERKAIERWLAQNATSPVTRAHMGPRLMEDYAAKNTIETLVTSGDIEGELAEAWQKKLAVEKVVKEWRAKAEGGDWNAMYCLGVWYQFGLHGLAKDAAQARAWYELSGAARNPKGMASFGQCLLLGIGGPEDHVFGIMNVTEAAMLGSDLGAYRLGWAFSEGDHGLPKDPVRARYWLKKVVDGECEHKQLTDSAIADAANWLRELDE